MTPWEHWLGRDVLTQWVFGVFVIGRAETILPVVKTS